MAAELVVLAVSSGAVVVSTVASLSAWLSARRSTVKVTIRRGRDVVELDARRPLDAEMIIKAFLADHANDERPSTAPSEEQGAGE